MTTNIPKDWTSIINRLSKKHGADDTAPAFTYGAFIHEATNTFVEKSTDYDDRYLRGLIALDARTIWKWEVDKKLDRLRTWLKRGELQVKGEGIRNSVDDLFIYSVQYVAYIQHVVNDGMTDKGFLHMVRADREGFFSYRAARLTPSEWVEFLVNKGLIEEDEAILQLLLQSYMGADIAVEDWQNAIRATLKK